MHASAKLLSGCVALLMVLTNALPTREFNSKIIYSKSSETQNLTYDTLQRDNLILRDCHPSDDNLKKTCEISGLPEDETTLQRCNLTISAMFNDSVWYAVADIYRLKDNKLVVFSIDEVIDTRKSTKDSQAFKRVGSLHIFDKCALVNVVGYVTPKDTIVIYEDGFDVFRKGDFKENATMHYETCDSDGKQIGDYPIVPEQFPPLDIPLFRSPFFMNVAKEHSQGVAFSNGYHYYPNGTIVKFADDEFINVMKDKGLHDLIDVGAFYTVCTRLSDDTKKYDRVGCWQYDLDNARLVLKEQIPFQGEFSDLKNLSKGGFLLALKVESKIIVYVFRPDHPTFIDNFDISSDDNPYISNFNEVTGEITVLNSSKKHTVISRYSNFLKNYATN